MTWLGSFLIRAGKHLLRRCRSWGRAFRSPRRYAPPSEIEPLTRVIDGALLHVLIGNGIGLNGVESRSWREVEWKFAAAASSLVPARTSGPARRRSGVIEREEERKRCGQQDFLSQGHKHPFPIGRIRCGKSCNRSSAGPRSSTPIALRVECRLPAGDGDGVASDRLDGFAQLLANLAVSLGRRNEEVIAFTVTMIPRLPSLIT